MLNFCVYTKKELNAAYIPDFTIMLSIYAV